MGIRAQKGDADQDASGVGHANHELGLSHTKRSNTRKNSHIHKLMQSFQKLRKASGFPYMEDKPAKPSRQRLRIFGMKQSAVLPIVLARTSLSKDESRSIYQGFIVFSCLIKGFTVSLLCGNHSNPLNPFLPLTPNGHGRKRYWEGAGVLPSVCWTTCWVNGGG